MSKPNYSDKLKDPRWQRRRLEVMNLAGFRCEWCQDDKETLHIHHLKYTGEPWEAPLEDLECLCASCHQEREREDGFRVGFSSRAAITRRFINAVLRFKNRGESVDSILIRICNFLEEQE